ncbi:FadR family transcriptional regulator [Roseomonas sp. OT10]|uniref:FadR/GntR family transcriptional regulator n=1 Tax=Roseomonas cutis TaxID=2897332 RepID=UPI001E2C22E7|nr:FadR/GntR family transcriptional regulator [Roseomonas sp. OT10]UFN48944.1 FadR family transcriptional regulator [Roseomonas sp. OT10]
MARGPARLAREAAAPAAAPDAVPERAPAERMPADQASAERSPTERSPTERSPTLGERVGEQLRRLIEHGEFPRDCKLPTEFELCRRFGVSRPVLRDALARLREEGYVSSQRGSGTVVLRGPNPGSLRFPVLRSVADVEQYFDFRIAVEGEAAHLAALRHTPETLAGIEAALREAEELPALGAPDLAGDMNFRFHRAVAQASQNQFFIVTLEQMPNLIGIARVEVRNFGLAEPLARARLIAAEHRSILEAIRARDGLRARLEMQAHIGAARQHIYERHPLRLEPGTG